MPAYVIAKYDITDPECYQAYGPLAGPAVAAYGGEVVTAGPPLHTLEGKAPATVVVLRFPSAEVARDWYESPEYQEALSHRLGSTSDNLLLVADAFTPPA